jgi:putative PIN family toxin of toxin-antitoxin system
LRFVFDTNAVVSALLIEDSISRRAFDRASDRGRFLLSLPVLAEINEVLGREKFRKYITEDEAKRFLAAFVRKAEWVEVNVKISASRDPSDNILLELAVSGEATHIITGDKDLLALSPFQGILILPPGDFLQQLGLSVQV